MDGDGDTTEIIPLDLDGNPRLMGDPATVDVGAYEYSVCQARINDVPVSYATVQAAVDAAAEGDTVKVAGYCIGVNVRPRNDITTTGVVTQVVYVSKTVSIQGGYTTTNWTISDPEAHPTTLDAQGRGRVLYITGDISPTIEGLRITGGNAAGFGGAPYGNDAGGGVYVLTATAAIRDNQVSNNTAYHGGGLYLHSSTSTLSGNIVSSNVADFGGGLYLLWSDAMLNGNIVSSNTGSGLHLGGSAATLSGNIVSSNTGSGLQLAGSAATLSGNIVSSNTGVGLGLAGSDATLSGNTVFSNTGGGLELYRSDATLTNNIVTDNQTNTAGSGLRITASSPRLIHTTIARNHGGDGSGIYVTHYASTYSSVALTNTILVSHSVGISVTGGNTVTVDAVLWNDTLITVSQSITAVVTVQNQHTGNPAFAPDGYHLTVSSAAIDRGVDAGVTTDIDGGVRPFGPAPDLGADEADFIVVTSTADSGPGTLRQVLLDAVSGNTIVFDPAVFPPTSPAAIALTSGPLPDITQGNLAIDGSGAGVILDGSNLVSGDGFHITSNGNTIQGMQILFFPDEGVRIDDGVSNNLIGGSNATPGGACTGATAAVVSTSAAAARRATLSAATISAPTSTAPAPWGTAGMAY
jgi:parallel beta-helix repeat protein